MSAVAVVDVPLGYSVNIERAIQVLNQVAAEADHVEEFAKDMLEPAEVLGVEKVTAETVTLRLTAKVRPGDATGHTKLGAILVTIGRAADAREEFVTALGLDPRNETARRALTFLDRMEGRHGSDGARR